MDVTEQGRAALRRACDIAGGQAALAKAIGTVGQRIDNWLKRDKVISSDFCPAIELATGGCVRCEDLRPDVRWDVLRQSAAPTPEPTPAGEASHA